MLSRSELYNIAIKTQEDKVEEILDGAFDHIVTRIEEKANAGEFKYIFHCKKIRTYCRETLLRKCIEMIKPIEKCGLKVGFADEGDDRWTELYICMSWDNQNTRDTLESIL